MKTKLTSILITVILTCLALLGLQALVSNRIPGFATPAAAQNIVSGQFYGVTNDTFIITSSSSGAEVFVYYFDSNPQEELSSIKFITKTKAP
ncbi:hypothetical protein JW926_16925 [Candidatus Sumerlaeota bacterium]|nr:hypothetical protein [Candidatus Sumerlaeota bacterium]